MEQIISNQTSQVTPTASSPPPPAPPIITAPPTKKTNWLLILGGCLIVVLITLIALFGFGGYFINKYLTIFKKEILPKVQVTPTITETQPLVTVTTIPSPLPTTLEKNPEDKSTADWKTYSKTVSFKYPANITLTEAEPGNPAISLSLFGPSQKKDTEAYDGLFLTFYLPEKLNGKSFTSYVQEQFSQEQKNLEIIGGTMDKGLEEIEIAGLKGYTYTLTGLGTHQYIYLPSPKEGEVIKITNSTVDPTNQGFKKTVEQILASFKFIQ